MAKHGFTTLWQWGKYLEDTALAVADENERAACGLGLDFDVDDFVSEEICDIKTGDDVCIYFKNKTICLKECDLKEYERIDFSAGECRLVAVELYDLGDGVCELHCLISQNASNAVSLYNLTCSGRIGLTSD